MSYFTKAIALLLVSFSSFGAATTNKTPILRGLLQGNLDGNAQQITNVAAITSTNFIDASTGLPVSARSVPPAILFVATNGNDSSSGWVATAPLLTISNAVAKATNGTTIFLNAGTYNLGTNQIILPDGVNLYGFQRELVNIIGFADCAGREAGKPTGGPQIHPGNNSTLKRFTLTCDTNALIAGIISPGYSGTWAGIGVSYLNPPANQGFTNVLIEDVKIEKFYFDGFHINTTGRVDVVLDNCYFDGQGTCINVDCATVPNPQNRVLVKNTFGKSGADIPTPINSALAMLEGCFAIIDSPVTFENCTGLITTNGGGAAALSGTIGTTRLLMTDSAQAGSNPRFLLRGCSFSTMDPNDSTAYALTTTFGDWVLKGTNFVRGFAQSSVVTNGLSVGTNRTSFASNLVTWATSTDQQALHFGTDGKLWQNGGSTFVGPITNAALTASQIVGTDGGKGLTSIAVGSGLNLAAGTLTSTGSGAATSEPFVTIGNSAGLSAERALTGTANQITVTDGGANSTVTLSIPSSPTIGGTLTAGTFSGSGASLTSIPESAVTSLVTDLASKSAGGYTICLFSASSGAPAASTTYYFGGDPTPGQNTVYVNTRIEIPKAGTIKRVFYKVKVSGTLASGETVTHLIRINDTTDVASSTCTYNAAVVDTVNSSVNQAVVAGDYICWKVVTPAWGTLPTTVKFYALVYIE